MILIINGLEPKDLDTSLPYRLVKLFIENGHFVKGTISTEKAPFSRDLKVYEWEKPKSNAILGSGVSYEEEVG